jgi:PAS domain-containing protein
VHGQVAPDLPFIIVPKAAREDQGLGSFRRGVRDLFVNGSLARFGPAVARELAEADARQAGRRAERDEASSSPSRARDPFRSLIDQMPARLFGRDSRSRYTIANQALADLWGTTVGAIVGRACRELGGAAALVAACDRADRDPLLHPPERS